MDLPPSPLASPLPLATASKKGEEEVRNCIQTAGLSSKCLNLKGENPSCTFLNMITVFHYADGNQHFALKLSRLHDEDACTSGVQDCVAIPHAWNIDAFQDHVEVCVSNPSLAISHYQLLPSFCACIVASDIETVYPPSRTIHHSNRRKTDPFL